MERGLLAGLAAFRWAAWAWMAAVLLVNRDDLERAWVAVALVALAFAVTAAATIVLRANPQALLGVPAVTVELTVGLGLLVGDGVAYGDGHAFGGGTQSLGSAWPLAGVLSAGLALGAGGGLGSGLLLGLGRLAGVLANGPESFTGGQVLSLASTAVLYMLAGGAAGFAAGRARVAEREITAARAREDVARHLHDGVLQTLAVIQRRSADTTLVGLAHRQERELRNFLALGAKLADDGLEPSLRRAAARFEDLHGARATVVLADDLPSLPSPTSDALVGAVSEALANAAKHGRAQQVTIYCEPADDGGVSCSVKDDGCGFEPATVSEGMGLTRSVKGRLTEVGGRVDVSSAPGRGAEVRMWVPA